jgi:NAD(P)-dependent dehydrogenase (short-subunit alcohol dehydrogenase family)
MGHESNAKFGRNGLFDFKGKVALVTGAGTGIGLIATQVLAINGARVYIVGRTDEKLQRVADLYGTDIEGEIIPLSADVTKKDEITKLYKEYSSREKCLCVLVNNAGIDGPTFETQAKTADEFKMNLFDHEDATFEDWESTYRTNVASVYFMTTAFLPLLQNSTDTHLGFSSTVINIASISGMVKDSQHHPQYNSSKAGTIHLTRMLANMIAENNLKVRVNAISPGVFPSEMTAGESGNDQKSHIPKEKYANKVPAQRPGRDEDMAQTVLFMAANQYLNGQNLAVDGGYTLVAGL